MLLGIRVPASPEGRQAKGRDDRRPCPGIKINFEWQGLVDAPGGEVVKATPTVVNFHNGCKHARTLP
jgi:hypothetical protein